MQKLLTSTRSLVLKDRWLVIKAIRYSSDLDDAILSELNELNLPKQ